MSQQSSIRRALLSVWDKSGIVEFARALHAEFAVELLSTGGTAQTLRDAGIPVTLIEDLTGFPEMLGGRVKTLHPAVHAGILADRANPDHLRQLAQAGIAPIELVVVDLYPFEQAIAAPGCTPEQAIEMIDIGGVALLRAAAKNHQHVVAIATVAGRERLLACMRSSGAGPDAMFRAEMAFEALREVTRYDAQIAAWLAARAALPGYIVHEWRSRGALRYGENAHQAAELCATFDSAAGPNLARAAVPPTAAAVAAQPALSYNNYLDADAALGLCAELTRAAGAAPAAPAVVFVKHNNPCGAAVQADRFAAYRQAYLADPNAAMGGVLAVNFEVDAEFAAAVMETYDQLGRPLKEAGAPFAPGGFFVEVWLAPQFHPQAVALIRARKKWGENVRLLGVGEMRTAPAADARQQRTIAGGLLLQTPDLAGLDEGQWRIASRRPPSAAELDDLRLAWLICKHTRSNAISIVRDGMLLGNGAGQMSRVMSCRVATWLARENGHAGRLPGSVAASDAFFPFADGPRLLIEAGVRAIIQPGGSKRDDETLALCDAHDVALILTGTRHFRH